MTIEVGARTLGVLVAGLTTERDQARRIAVALEQECAELTERVTSALDLLRTWTPPGIAPDRWAAAAEAVVARLDRTEVLDRVPPPSSPQPQTERGER